VCNSGYTDLGSGVCYKIATTTYTCVTGYTVSGSTCYANGLTAASGRSGYYIYCPTGTPVGVTVSRPNCTLSTLTNCCSYPAVVSRTCPSGVTPTIHGSTYYCV
jgi:hypothetical protein